jgi:hypothetical protein
MRLRCLLAITTKYGNGYAVVYVNSLVQLAFVMPASVLSYDIQEIVDDVFTPAHVIDSELYKELLNIVEDAHCE